MAKIPNRPQAMIRAKVESLSVDRHQYKPYNAVLTFDPPLFIEIPVDTAEVEEEKGGTIILTLDGFTAMITAYADALDRMHTDYQNRYR